MNGDRVRARIQIGIAEIEDGDAAIGNPMQAVDPFAEGLDALTQPKPRQCRKAGRLQHQT